MDTLRNQKVQENFDGWDRIKAGLKEAADAVIGKKRIDARKPWTEDKCVRIEENIKKGGQT